LSFRRIVVFPGLLGLFPYTTWFPRCLNVCFFFYFGLASTANWAVVRYRLSPATFCTLFWAVTGHGTMKAGQKLTADWNMVFLPLLFFITSFILLSLLTWIEEHLRGQVPDMESDARDENPRKSRDARCCSLGRLGRPGGTQPRRHSPLILIMITTHFHFLPST